MQDTIAIILEKVQNIESKEFIVPFYKSLSFWIPTIVSVIGAFLSWRAFKEAEGAKKAASQAGKAVKIQTLTIELTELIQRLDSLSTDIKYHEARDLSNEINRRVRRMVANLKNAYRYKTVCDSIETALIEVRKNLEESRPKAEGTEDLTGSLMYYGIEGSFSKLSGLLAELTGLLENRNIEKN